MVIDSSAIISILLGEPDAEQFEAAILGDAVRVMSAVSFVETSIVTDRHYSDKAFGQVDGFVSRTRIQIVPVLFEQAEAARLAFRRFGKGRHKAGLNFGDCFTYALAKVSGEPLLHKGNDFGLTDLAVISLPPSLRNM